MKKHSKAIKITAIVSVVATLCSCLHTAGDRVVTPEEYGYAVGTAAYIGYYRIASRKDDSFREKVETVWAAVNEIDSTDTLASDVARIAAQFAAVEDDEALTEPEKAALNALAHMVLARVDGKLADQAMSQADAVAFLKGVRDGVNAAAGM
jgi:thiamine biosynthesis lipoprotein ApbE